MYVDEIRVTFNLWNTNIYPYMQVLHVTGKCMRTVIVSIFHVMIADNNDLNATDLEVV